MNNYFDPPYVGFPSALRTQFHTEQRSEVVLMGIPLDSSTSNRSGAREGPRAIREASMMLYDGVDPWFRIDQNVFLSSVYDGGDIVVKQTDLDKSFQTIKDACLEKLKYSKILGIMGGDHSVAYPHIKAIYEHLNGEKIGLVHFDSHSDLWGGDLNHGTIFRHLIEENIIDPERMVQIGLRSPMPQDVIDFKCSNRIQDISVKDIYENKINDIVYNIMKIIGSGPTFLSIDIDVFDPSVAPGTGTPESGGLQAWQVISIIEQLFGNNFYDKLNIVGFDVVEVCPSYDQSSITSILAANLIYKICNGFLYNETKK